MVYTERVPRRQQFHVAPTRSRMRVEVAVVGSTDHNFRRERRAETDWNRGPSAYQPNALPLGHTGSHDLIEKTPFYRCLVRMPIRQNCRLIVAD